MERDAYLTWSWQPLYDTCIMPASGIGRLNFFQVQRGAIGGGFSTCKTESETNMYTGGQIGYPNQFLLYGFAAAIPESTSKEDRSAIKQGVFKFYSGWNRLQFESLMLNIPVNPIEDNEFFIEIDNKLGITELPYKTGFYYLLFPNQLPLLIDGGVYFKVEIGYPAGPVPLPSGKNCRVVVFMIGCKGND